MADASAVVSAQASAWHAKGEKALGGGDLDGAIYAFSKAIFLAPSDAVHYAARGECYLKLCDFQSAVLNFRKASALAGPHHLSLRHRLAYVQFAMGQCHLACGEVGDAVVAFTEATHLHPDNTLFFVHRVRAYVAAKEYERALSLLNRYLPPPTSALAFLSDHTSAVAVATATVPSSALTTARSPSKGGGAGAAGSTAGSTAAGGGSDITRLSAALSQDLLGSSAIAAAAGVTPIKEAVAAAAAVTAAQRAPAAAVDALAFATIPDAATGAAGGVGLGGAVTAAGPVPSSDRRVHDYLRQLLDATPLPTHRTLTNAPFAALRADKQPFHLHSHNPNLARTALVTAAVRSDQTPRSRLRLPRDLYAHVASQQPLPSLGLLPPHQLEVAKRAKARRQRALEKRQNARGVLAKRLACTSAEVLWRTDRQRQLQRDADAAAASARLLSQTAPPRLLEAAAAPAAAPNHKRDEVKQLTAPLPPVFLTAVPDPSAAAAGRAHALFGALVPVSAATTAGTGATPALMPVSALQRNLSSTTTLPARPLSPLHAAPPQPVRLRPAQRGSTGGDGSPAHRPGSPTDSKASGDTAAGAGAEGSSPHNPRTGRFTRRRQPAADANTPLAPPGAGGTAANATLLSVLAPSAPLSAVPGSAASGPRDGGGGSGVGRWADDDTDLKRHTASAAMSAAATAASTHASAAAASAAAAVASSAAASQNSSAAASSGPGATAPTLARPQQQQQLYGPTGLPLQPQQPRPGGFGYVDTGATQLGIVTRSESLLTRGALRRAAKGGVLGAVRNMATEVRAGVAAAHSSYGAQGYSANTRRSSVRFRRPQPAPQLLPPPSSGAMTPQSGGSVASGHGHGHGGNHTHNHNNNAHNASNNNGAGGSGSSGGGGGGGGGTGGSGAGAVSKRTGATLSIATPTSGGVDPNQIPIFPTEALAAVGISPLPSPMHSGGSTASFHLGPAPHTLPPPALAAVAVNATAATSVTVATPAAAAADANKTTTAASFVMGAAAAPTTASVTPAPPAPATAPAATAEPVSPWALSSIELNVEARLLRATIWLAQGDTEAAQKDIGWAALLVHPTDDTDVPLPQAEAEAADAGSAEAVVRRQRHTALRERVQHLQRQLNVQADALWTAASAFALSGQPDEALLALTRAMELNPTNHALYVHRAALYRRQRNFDAAVADLRTCIGLCARFRLLSAAPPEVLAALPLPPLPGSAAAATARDSTSTSSGSGSGSSAVPGLKLDGASTALVLAGGATNPATAAARPPLLLNGTDAVSELLRQFTLLFHALAGVSYRASLFGDAIACLDRALELQPTHAALCVERGDCYRRLGDLPAAVDSYERALAAAQLAPATVGGDVRAAATGALVAVPFAMSVSSAAAAAMASVVRDRLALVNYEQGRVAYNQLNYSLALQQFSLAIQYSPNHAVWYVSRAHARLFVQDVRGAYEDAQTAVVLDRDNAEAARLLHSLQGMFVQPSDRAAMAALQARFVKPHLPSSIQSYLKDVHWNDE